MASGGGARVESIDAIRAFRAAIFKFAETAGRALDDAESEMGHVLNWLENEQRTYWADQIRKRHEAVEKCKEAVRMKKLYKSPTGGRQSATDEEKALAVAQRRLEEAQTKALNVKRHVVRLQKEIHIYKGAVQRFRTTVEVDLPAGAAELEKMLQSLDEYVALQAPDGTVEPSMAYESDQRGPSMAQPEPEPPALPSPADAQGAPPQHRAEETPRSDGTAGPSQ